MSDERKPMTPEYLDGIKGRLAAITEWPWIVFCRTGVGHRMGITNKRLFDADDAPEVLDVVELGEDAGGIKSEADAAFIANAPTDIARLLAEVERLREEVKRRDAFIAQQRSFSQSLEEDLNFQAAVEDALIKKLFDHRICHRKWQCEQVDKPEWEFNDDEDEQRCHSCWSQWACDEAKAMFKEGGTMTNNRSDAALRERLGIAEKATPKGESTLWMVDPAVPRDLCIRDAFNERILTMEDCTATATAHHIAASSPDVVQADIEEILRLRQEVARLNKESTKIMDVAICLAEMMDGKHELCPRDCDVLPSAIKCNQYTDFNGEADCDATKCWLHVALNYSADCQHNDEDMGDFHALYEAMLRKEVRKTVEEEERHG